MYKAWNKDSESVLYHGVMLVWKQEWETTMLHGSIVSSPLVFITQGVEAVIVNCLLLYHKGIGVDCRYSGGETTPQSCYPFAPPR